jgi:hypothetical protein
MGLLGFAASGVDGFEVNLLGLNFGISSNGLKLPMVGRIGGFKPAAPTVAVPEVTATVAD